MQYTLFSLKMLAFTKSNRRSIRMDQWNKLVLEGIRTPLS